MQGTYQSKVLSANTTGVQLGVVGANAASAAGAAAIAGILHSITFSADSTATTVTVYDGTSTSGAVLAKIVTPTATVPVTLLFDLQAQVGLFVAVAGATTPNINFSFQ
jgi:hypothetical protein